MHWGLHIEMSKTAALSTTHLL